MARITDFSADELEDGILRALRAGDAEAVQALMIGLAIVDADRADTMLLTITLGLKIAQEDPDALVRLVAATRPESGDSGAQS